MGSWDKDSNSSIRRTLASEGAPSAESRPQSSISPLAPLLSDHHIVDGLTEHGAVFLFVYSPTAKSLVSWSDNAAAVLGVRDVAIARDGNVFLRHVHPDDRFALFSDLERALNGEGNYRATYRWIRPDTNQVRWLHCRGGLRFRGSESLFEGFVIDVSAELSSTEGNVRGGDSLTGVFAALPMTLFTLDRDLRITRTNRPIDGEIRTDFGDPLFKSDQFAVGKSFLNGFTSRTERQHIKGLLERITSGEIRRHEMRTSNGAETVAVEFRAIQESGTTTGIVGIITDISATVALENRVSELHMSEGLRTLATGVVHNLNNALQRIIGQAALLSDNAADPAAVERLGTAITAIAARTGELTRELLAFDADAHAAPVPVDLNVITMAATNRIKDLFSAGLTISLALGSIGSVMGRHEPLVDIIERVLRTLQERIPRGGSLAIKTSEVEDAAGDRPASVRVTIIETDEGERASTDNESLLALVGTIQQELARFGGSLTTERDPSGRLSVTIALPVPAGMSEVSIGREPIPIGSKAPAILIVDDDRMVLDTMQAVLKDLGYETCTASDATTALQLVRDHTASLRLVLLDALMPGTDGATLLRRILRRAPHMKVLGFSGAPQHITDTLLQAGALRVIRKPVEPALLKEVVESIMVGKEAA